MVMGSHDQRRRSDAAHKCAVTVEFLLSTVHTIRQLRWQQRRLRNLIFDIIPHYTAALAHCHLLQVELQVLLYSVC